jgi:CheY-like chemotaxis protein
MPGRSSADKGVTPPTPPEGPAEPLEVVPVSSISPEALALSVGHAINNPLAAILTNLDLASDLLRDEGNEPRARTEALGLLGDVRQAAERIQAVVQHLRATALPTQAPTVAPTPVPALAFSDAEPVTDAKRSKVRVLVVDDDVLVGNALRRALRDYDVVVLDNAKGALARLVGGERFDVIFCDLMMPEMTGMDLHEEILRVASDQAQRMVFVTGGAVTTRARDFVATVPNPVVDKPFDVKKLREMIRERVGLPRRDV